MPTPFEQLLQHKIIAIIRGVTPPLLDQTIQALADGGIKFIEVTMNTEGAAAAIARWSRSGDEEICFGAGTVLDREMAEEAVAAGARFMISPNLDEQVLAYGQAHQVPVWPGVMTPTEIVRARKAGAEAVKIFPMKTLGLDYLKEIRGPLNTIPMIATGGVDISNIARFIEAGAAAVGIGGSLVNQAMIREQKFEELTELARQFVRAAAAGGVSQ